MTRQNENYNRYLLSDWRPENPAFWENKGKGIARRNLSYGDFWCMEAG